MIIRFIGRASVAALCCCSTSVVSAAAPFDPDGDYLLGDWGGVRPELAEQGLKFELEYTGEAAHNLSGGFRRDGRLAYADQFTLDASFDLDRLVGLSDAEFRVALTNRNGENLTRERLINPATEAVSSVQEIHGRGNVTRLTRLWYRQGWRDGGVEIKVGRMPVGDDFAVFESDFQNLYLGGNQPGNQAGELWYNWPVSQWAARLRVGDDAGRYAQVGVFDVNPENLDPDHGLSLYRHGTEGALVPVEIGWRRGGELPGDYKLGGYYSNVESEDYGDGGGTGRRYGGWLVALQQVSAPHGDERGLSLFAMATWHDTDTAYVARYLAMGATYQGPLPFRPDDDIGIGLAYAEVGDPYVSAATADNAGLTPADPGFVPPQSDEWNLEIYYGIQLTAWLTVRPNLQFMANPGANDRVDDAWVLGTRLEATL